MSFDLSGYKPETVKDNTFEMMKGKGHICKVNSSIIEEVEAGENERGAYDAYTRLKYELEVISDQYKGRRVWKSVNNSPVISLSFICAVDAPSSTSSRNS